MSEPPSVDRASVGNGPSGRRAIALVVVLMVGFIGLAIAKPWASQRPISLPTPTASSNAEVVVPPLSPTPIALRPDAFVTPLPPAATARWTGLSWRLLPLDDPLTLVRYAMRWPGGFVAVGGDALGPAPTTPLWTSADGAHWDALPFGTAPTVWPGMFVRGVTTVPSGLAMLTERLATDCGGQPCSGQYAPRVVAWTSPDGRLWSPQPFPDLGPPPAPDAAPLLAGGPAGLVAVSSGRSAQVATSRDGIRWATLPDQTLPAGLSVVTLHETSTGYVLGGTMEAAGGGAGSPALFWSADGQTWTRTPTLSSAAVVNSLVAGREGLIAVGRLVGAPGADIWWSSPDGRAWQVLDGFPPVGRTTCSGCGEQANGVLVGDGARMVAMSYQPDAEACTSIDGHTWQQLVVTGDLPSELARRAIMLPGGVLLTDGFSTWFGQAVVN